VCECVCEREGASEGGREGGRRKLETRGVRDRGEGEKAERLKPGERAPSTWRLRLRRVQGRWACRVSDCVRMCVRARACV
jgi:hypothetical protein